MPRLILYIVLIGVLAVIVAGLNAIEALFYFVIVPFMNDVMHVNPPDYLSMLAGPTSSVLLFVAGTLIFILVLVVLASLKEARPF
jgi:hypothetical protein